MQVIQTLPSYLKFDFQSPQNLDPQGRNRTSGEILQTLALPLGDRGSDPN
jgi:hypothetical protein